MPDTDLQRFLTRRTDTFLDQYRAAEPKYQAIWQIYRARMPGCIAGCAQEAANRQGAWRDGPQGIYWIGAEVKILFVGREHFGWYGDQDWDEGRDSILFRPLEFAFGAAGSMAGYWSIVRQLLADCLGVDVTDWDEVLRQVAFTNACKCLGDGGYRRILHDNCQAAGYLAEEFRIVDAPLNIFFTRSLDLVQQLFGDSATSLSQTDDFAVVRVGRQTIIECDHPGRQSHAWRQRLAELIRKGAA